MSSVDIKEQLVEAYPGTAISHWKRTSKRKIGTQEVRTFVNEKTGVEVFVHDDGESITEVGPMLFYAVAADDEAAEWMDIEDGDVMVMFAPKGFWEKNHCITDQHFEFTLVNHYGADPADFEELSENQFLSNLPLEEVKAKLTALGMTFTDMSTAAQ